MPAVLPASSGVISATQTNAQQKVAFGSMLDYLAERLGSFTTTGTSTAYIGTPVPAVTAYFAGLSFLATLHVASGASPTLQISGLATPPNMVRRLQNGTYQNVSSLPAGPYRITLVSATQALAESVDPLIVGTVSQAAGVPTGAIIERGSNANGEYVRFADGMQICNLTFGASSVIANAMTQFLWTYPAAFAFVPVCGFSPGAPNLSEDVYGICRIYARTVTETSFGYRNGATAQVINNFAVTAIGRWF